MYYVHSSCANICTFNYSHCHCHIRPTIKIIGFLTIPCGKKRLIGIMFDKEGKQHIFNMNKTLQTHIRLKGAV